MALVDRELGVHVFRMVKLEAARMEEGGDLATLGLNKRWRLKNMASAKSG
jgi:hypothetical protein